MTGGGGGGGGGGGLLSKYDCFISGGPILQQYLDKVTLDLRFLLKCVFGFVFTKQKLGMFSVLTISIGSYFHTR